MGNDEFQKKVKESVAEKTGLSVDQIYIVWMVKVLQNNKALASTTENDGLYFEVTYDGNNDRAFIDEYIKSSNEELLNFGK